MSIYRLTGSRELNVKALVGTFNQEKALVGAFSVVVQLQTSRRFVLSSKLHPPAVPRVEAVQVGCGDATHLGRVVSLQRWQQRLADVEVSVLQFALYQLFYQLAREV